MTKQETLNFLYELKRVLWKDYDLCVELNRIQSNINMANSDLTNIDSIKKAKISDNVFLIIVGGFFSLLGGALASGIVFLLAIILQWLKNAITIILIWPSSANLIVSIVVGALICLVIFFFMWRPRATKKEHEKQLQKVMDTNAQITKLRNNLPNLHSEYQRIQGLRSANASSLAVLKNRGVLHPNYFYRQDVDSLIELLEHGRADTLKEAINLYEHECRENRRDQEEWEYRRQQEALAHQQLEEIQNVREETSRAANAAEDASSHAADAAFWSAATTYLVDKEIRKNNKS